MATDPDDIVQISTDAGFSPPYTSFKTLMNTVERMAADGAIPSRIDRSYLSNLPGGAQTILLAGMKSLGLIDDQAKPTHWLRDLVEDPDNRPLIVQDVLKERYVKPLALGTNATQAQLEESFREYGVTGSTLRKAVAFFLSAAKFADLPLSPHFRTPRQGSNQTGRRRPRARTVQRNGGRPDPAEEPGFKSSPSPASGEHPFIQGLLQTLPRVGTTWPLAERKKWTAAALAAFDVIYELPPEDASPPTKEAGE